MVMTASLHPTAAPGVDRSARWAFPLRVMVADDHGMARRSLRLLLDGENDFEVIAEATDLSTVTRHLRRYTPHVLVLDLQLANGSSVETIRRLRAQAPETEIVVLSMDSSPLFAQQTLDAGAAAFVLKTRADSELPGAVRAAAAGIEYISPRLAPGVDALRHGGGHGLSPRETEVLRLIALGHTSAEIAAKLHLSPRTVETHRAHIHRKLGLRTRAELVQYALRQRLLVP
jgi:two-component system response regulator NreC